jgi:acyl-CoA reductase-like NAD-dependent aldehyde dehydrogenase
MLPGSHKGLPRVFNKAVEQACDLLVIGNPDRLEHYSGPVVSATQFEKIMGYT